LIFDLICYIIIGIIAGICSGLFGIGGGVVIIPALMFLQGFSQLKAQGTSLIALLPPVGILAFLEYNKKGNTDLYAGSAIPVLNKNTCGRRLNFLIFRNNFISLSTCIEYES
jgi:uncharacterized membrane protein YfcA